MHDINPFCLGVPQDLYVKLDVKIRSPLVKSFEQIILPYNICLKIKEILGFLIPYILFKIQLDF